MSTKASTRPEGARQGRARSAPLPMSSWRLWPTKSKPNGTCLGGTAALFQEAPQGVATRWRQIAHHCYDWKQRRKYKRDMCSQVAQVAAANFTHWQLESSSSSTSSSSPHFFGTGSLKQLDLDLATISPSRFNISSSIQPSPAKKTAFNQ